MSSDWDQLDSGNQDEEMHSAEPVSENAHQMQKAAEGQVLNHAGGFVFEVDDLTRLRRFLILGSDGSHYYTTEAKLKYENALCIVRLLEAGKGADVVKDIVTISVEGRAPKQSPGVFALALCARLGDGATKAAALAAVNKVCRTASTLFEFVEQCKELGKVARAAAGEADAKAKLSWGRAMRRAIANWYLEKQPKDVAYQITKYSQRGGWSHADLLRLAHPDPEAHAAKRQKREAAAGGAAAADASKAAAGVGGEEGDELMGPMPEEVAQESLKAIEERGETAAPGSMTVALTPAARLRVQDFKALFTYITKGTLPNEPAADATAGATTAATACDLSAVMQYLADAQRLRKDIRAPAPKPKEKPVEAEGEAAAEAPEPAAPARPAGRGARSVRGGRGRGRARMAAPRYGADSDDNAMEVEEKKEEVDPDQAAALAVAIEEACALIRKHRFSHEHVGDTALLKAPQIWGTILETGMPMTALVRNLGRLTSIGVLNEPSYLSKVTGALANERAVQAARLHPISLLEALKTYQSGHGDKGSLTWSPRQEVCQALETAFELAFKNVQPTGKRFLAGLDVSGSMGGATVCGMRNLTAREAAAAMMMTTVRTEPSLKVMAFQDKFVPFACNKHDKLSDIVQRAERLPFGSTDCSQPMLYAMQKKLAVDVFLVYTDNETYFGGVHPHVALKQYRKAMGIPAKLIVMAFSATSFTIADPSDAGMLDIAGLDSGVPKIIAEFVEGKV